MAFTYKAKYKAHPYPADFISADLKWDAHVSYIVNRANSCLYMLQKLKYHFVAHNDVATVFHIFCPPCIEI